MVAGGRPDTRKRCAVTVDRMMCESRRPRAYSTIISTIIANWWMRGCGARIDNYWARFAIDGERPRLTSDDEPSGRAASRSAGPSCRQCASDSVAATAGRQRNDRSIQHCSGYARTFPVFPHNLHARNARYRHYLAEVQNSFRLAFKHATPTPGATHQLSYQDATMAL